MSMHHNAYPGGEPPEPTPSWNEEQERAESDLLVGLHDIFDSAMDTDTRAHHAALDAGPAMEQSQRYAWPGYDESVMPFSYFDLIWTPKPDTLTAQAVQQITTFFPELRASECGIDLAESPYFTPTDRGTIIPNDIVVAIGYKNGQQHKYLLNGRGITPYTNGADLDFDSTELIEPRPDQNRPNVYAVTGHHLFVPYIAPVALRNMLLLESSFDRRSQPAA